MSEAAAMGDTAAVNWQDSAHGQTLQEIIDINAGARHELTALEARAWVAAVASFPKSVIDRFLLDWVSTQPVTRPLSIADLRAVVDPSFVSPDACLEQLRKLASRIGPYDSLTAEQVSPMLARTIEHMGGWARVCEVMPDPINADARFEWAAFSDRFNAAFKSASAADIQEAALPLEQRPAVALPKGLHEANRVAASLALAMRERRAALAAGGEAAEVLPALPGPGALEHVEPADAPASGSHWGVPR